MLEIIRPSWSDLVEVVESADEKLVICSPFYSAGGIERALDHLSDGTALHFWTRLKAHDWARGFAEPDELLDWLEMLESEGIEVNLGISNRLHAKVYATDGGLALLSSANLSEGGFGSNLELAVRFRGEEAAAAVRAVESLCEPDLRSMSLEQLRTWVDRHRPTIETVRDAIVKEEDPLASVQEDLEDILDAGDAESREVGEPEFSERDEFASWLSRNTGLAGAETLWHHYTNVRGENLTGHFKQFFFASRRFFNEHRELLEPVSEQLRYLAPDDIYQMDEPSSLEEKWYEHVQAHATVSTSYYNYSFLRRNLPEYLGGVVTSGGAGSGALKRMLPLVARYMLETGR